MNKQQTVKQNLKSLKYLQTNKLRPYFHQLTKLILLKKPNDPIQFLIEYLQKRNKKQIICIQGYDQENRIKLSKNIANKYNYKVIELSELFKGVIDWNGKNDKQINQKVLAQVNKVQNLYKGIVISGYPNNIVQADFIQKSSILPDRYFIMTNDQQTIKKYYQQKYDGNVDNLLERNRLELKQLHEILNDLVDKLPLDLEKATEKAYHTISLKANKKVMPYDSPRVLILYPPFLKPTNTEVFVDTFSLNPISVNETLKKLSNKDGFITHVESYIRKHKQISKQIQLAMIQTMAKSAASKNKGYALYGWPLNKDRLPLLKQHFFNPHLILIFELNKQVALEKFNNIDSQNADIFTVTKKPTQQQYLKMFDQYQQLIDELRGKNNIQTFSYQQSTDKVAKTFINLMDNPNVYS